MTSINAISFTANKKNKKEKKNIGGGALAVTAGVTTQKLSILPFDSTILKNFTGPNHTLTETDKKTLQEGANNVLNNIAKLSQKGVTINDMRSEVLDVGDLQNLSSIKQGYISGLNAKYSAPVVKGQNAIFVGKIPKKYKEYFKAIGIKENAVNINMDKAPLAVFHELGHAYNFNNSAIFKGLQKIRGAGQIAALVFAIIPAITKNHEAKEGEELTGKQKFTNGLRKASPILAGLSMMPMLLEEGMATLRGNKWAKEVFENTPELAKKVAKSNKWGLASYAIVTVAAGLGAFVSKKIKDNSDKKKALKHAQIQYEESKLSKIPENKVEAHQG